jgi:hypothetical protein
MYRQPNGWFLRCRPLTAHSQTPWPGSLTRPSAFLCGSVRRLCVTAGRQPRDLSQTQLRDSTIGLRRHLQRFYFLEQVDCSQHVAIGVIELNEVHLDQPHCVRSPAWYDRAVYLPSSSWLIARSVIVLPLPLESCSVVEQFSPNSQRCDLTPASNHQA